MLGISISLNAMSSHGTCTAVFVVVAAIIAFALGSIQTLHEVSWLAWVGASSIVIASKFMTIPLSFFLAGLCISRGLHRGHAAMTILWRVLPILAHPASVAKHTGLTTKRTQRQCSFVSAPPQHHLSLTRVHELTFTSS